MEALGKENGGETVVTISRRRMRGGNSFSLSGDGSLYLRGLHPLDQVFCLDSPQSE
jgi:hypothetical protein